MANKKAARKAGLQSQRRALENCGVRNKLKTLAKRLRVSAEDTQGIRRMAMEYVSALDKAAKRNIVHRNFANKRKRNVARFLFV
ncbi:MAG: 30S ribosomal protein S20 [Puniceicoccales bacterium]|jgi:small subunit ribosomal protein S20|nr:30S ribosomal protein S20 [Puniceicoccales bacterium]